MHPVFPSLEHTQLVRAYFLVCAISNDPKALLLPEQISGFSGDVPVIVPTFLPAERQLMLRLIASVQATNEANEELIPHATFVVEFVYHIANYDEIAVTHSLTRDAAPPHALVEALVGAAYSTARGMIMSKVSDTIFAGYSLPLVTVQELITQSQALILKNRTQLELPTGPPRKPKRSKVD